MRLIFLVLLITGIVYGQKFCYWDYLTQVIIPAEQHDTVTDAMYQEFKDSCTKWICDRALDAGLRYDRSFKRIVCINTMLYKMTMEEYYAFTSNRRKEAIKHKQVAIRENGKNE